jgi:hypothetical protein
MKLKHWNSLNIIILFMFSVKKSKNETSKKYFLIKGKNFLRGKGLSGKFIRK